MKGWFTHWWKISSCCSEWWIILKLKVVYCWILSFNASALSWPQANKTSESFKVQEKGRTYVYWSQKLVPESMSKKIFFNTFFSFLGERNKYGESSFLLAPSLDAQNTQGLAGAVPGLPCGQQGCDHLNCCCCCPGLPLQCGVRSRSWRVSLGSLLSGILTARPKTCTRFLSNQVLTATNTISLSVFLFTVLPLAISCALHVWTINTLILFEIIFSF